MSVMGDCAPRKCVLTSVYNQFQSDFLLQGNFVNRTQAPHILQAGL